MAATLLAVTAAAELFNVSLVSTSDYYTACEPVDAHTLYERAYGAVYGDDGEVTMPPSPKPPPSSPPPTKYLPGGELDLMHDKVYTIKVFAPHLRGSSLSEGGMNRNQSGVGHRRLATLNEATSEIVLNLDSLPLHTFARRRLLRRPEHPRLNLSKHAAYFDDGVWNRTAPGDMLKFSPDAGDCSNAATLPPRFGGVLDWRMKTSIRLAIPPFQYFVCYAYGPFPSEDDDVRRLSEELTVVRADFMQIPLLANVFYEPPSAPPSPPPPLMPHPEPPPPPPAAPPVNLSSVDESLLVAFCSDLASFQTRCRDALPCSSTPWLPQSDFMFIAAGVGALLLLCCLFGCCSLVAMLRDRRRTRPAKPTMASCATQTPQWNRPSPNAVMVPSATQTDGCELRQSNTEDLNATVAALQQALQQRDQELSVARETSRRAFSSSALASQLDVQFRETKVGLQAQLEQASAREWELKVECNQLQAKAETASEACNTTEEAAARLRQELNMVLQELGVLETFLEASEAEAKASEAEAKASEAEAKASETELRASETCAKANAAASMAAWKAGAVKMAAEGVSAADLIQCAAEDLQAFAHALIHESKAQRVPPMQAQLSKLKLAHADVARLKVAPEQAEQAHLLEAGAHDAQREKQRLLGKLKQLRAALDDERATKTEVVERLRGTERQLAALSIKRRSEHEVVTTTQRTEVSEIRRTRLPREPEPIFDPIAPCEVTLKIMSPEKAVEVTKHVEVTREVPYEVIKEVIREVPVEAGLAAAPMTMEEATQTSAPFLVSVAQVNTQAKGVCSRASQTRAWIVPIDCAPAAVLPIRPPLVLSAPCDPATGISPPSLQPEPSPSSPPSFATTQTITLNLAAGDVASDRAQSLRLTLMIHRASANARRAAWRATAHTLITHGLWYKEAARRAALGTVEAMEALRKYEQRQNLMERSFTLRRAHMAAITEQPLAAPAPASAPTEGAAPLAAPVAAPTEGQLADGAAIFSPVGDLLGQLAALQLPSLPLTEVSKAATQTVWLPTQDSSTQTAGAADHSAPQSSTQPSPPLEAGRPDAPLAQSFKASACRSPTPAAAPAGAALPKPSVPNTAAAARCPEAVFQAGGRVATEGEGSLGPLGPLHRPRSARHLRRPRSASFLLRGPHLESKLLACHEATALPSSVAFALRQPPSLSPTDKLAKGDTQPEEGYLSAGTTEVEEGSQEELMVLLPAEATTTIDPTLDKLKEKLAKDLGAAMAAVGSVSTLDGVRTGMMEPPPHPALPSPAPMPAMLAAASQAGTLAQRRSIYVTAVVDNSPSMGVEKLAALQQSLEVVVTEVRAGLALGDRLGVVAFDDEASTKGELSAMNQRGMQHTLRYIRRMETTGHSNVSAGLMAGLRVLSSSPGSGGNNNQPLEAPPARALLLFTDFHSNRGITEGTILLDKVRSLIKEARAHHHVPIQIFTFGFGTMHDSVLLNAMAEAFGGRFYSLGGQLVLARECLVIEPPRCDQIKEAVADCFAHLRAVAALPAALHRPPASLNSLAPPSTHSTHSTHSTSLADQPARTPRLRPSTSEGVLDRQHPQFGTIRRRQQQHDAASQRASSASAIRGNYLPAVGAAPPPPSARRPQSHDSTLSAKQQRTARVLKAPTMYLLPHVASEPRGAAEPSWAGSSQPWRRSHADTSPNSASHSSMAVEDVCT